MLPQDKLTLLINNKIEGVRINRGLSEETDDDDEETTGETQDE